MLCAAAAFTCIRNWFNSIKSSTKLFSLRRKETAGAAGGGEVGGEVIVVVNTPAVMSQQHFPLAFECSLEKRRQRNSAEQGVEVPRAILQFVVRQSEK